MGSIVDDMETRECYDKDIKYIFSAIKVKHFHLLVVKNEIMCSLTDY